jgi:large subunit ribosomal protein L6
MELPQGFSIKTSGNTVTVSKGSETMEHFYAAPLVRLTVEGNVIKFEPIGKNRRATKSAVRTAEAHVRNMIKGLQTPYSKKLTLVYAHFPVTVEVKGSDVLIKNFLGEKLARKAKIAGKTKVKVAGQDITVEGPDKDDVGQTANNIAKATRITNKDIRVFQDGIYYA